MKFYAFGHRNIQAIHRTTIEITRDESITERGDCIVGVNATHAILDFKEELERFKGKRIEVILRISDMQEEITGYVHPKLTFEDERCWILRTSSFLCPKTLMINCNKAAFDLEREFVKKLKNSRESIEIEILPLKR